MTSNINCLRSIARLSALVAVGAALSCLSVAEATEPPPAPVTQGELAARLVKEAGWEAGLPAEPKPADYLAVLGGKRTLRFEAEDVYNVQGDNVSVRNYPLHGPFTGTGWLSGVAQPTTARFTVFLPREGEYLLKVVSRGDGQKWRAGGREFTVSTGGSLREAEAGKVFLTAGSQEITVLLPPEGGVDSLALAACDLPPVGPLDGWRPAAPLTRGDLAQTLASLLGIETQLPIDQAAGPRTIAVHAASKLPPTVSTTSAGFLGTFTPPKWVRVGAAGALLEVPLEVAETGVYGVRVRLLGNPVTLELEGRRFERPGKPFLDWHDLGFMRIEKGTHLLRIELPPMGGADVVELVKRKSSPADYLAVTGLKGDPRETVPRAEFEAALADAVKRLRGAR